MRVLETILFEFILGYILQAFGLVLGLNVFNKRKIEFKKYIITSMIMTVVIYITRLFPINFGVHTVLDFVAAFLLGILYLKLPVLSTVKALLITFAMILFIDLADSLILSNIIGHDKFEELMNNSRSRFFLSLPAAILFTGTILCSYYFLVLKRIKNKQINVKRCMDENI